MQTMVVGIFLLLLFVYGQADAQPRDGNWEGKNSKGWAISFLVAKGGTEFQIRSLINSYECPKGGGQVWGHGFGGSTAPIEEEGFQWDYGFVPPKKPIPGGIWTMRISGSFLDETHAEGMQEGWLASFSGRPVGSSRATQSCPTGKVPWTAEWVSVAPADSGTEEAHHPVQLIDKAAALEQLRE
ncbi:MAG: hypothetical protein AAB916_01425 [Patescibacteria group bacterium]